MNKPFVHSWQQGKKWKVDAEMHSGAAARLTIEAASESAAREQVLLMFGNKTRIVKVFEAKP